MGWKLDVPAPEKVTAEILDESLRKQSPIQKYRPCNFENCVMACPYTRAQ